MKKEKDFLPFITSLIQIFYGVFLLCSSFIFFENFKVLLILFFVIYGLKHFLLFCFSKRKNILTLLSSIVGLLFACGCFIFPIVENRKFLAISFLLFATCVSFIQLKKADYFHDHKSSYFLLEVAHFLFFLAFSILLSLNLSFSQDILTLFLGFYSFFLGVLEFDEILCYELRRGKI